MHATLVLPLTETASPRAPRAMGAAEAFRGHCKIFRTVSASIQFHSPSLAVFRDPLASLQAICPSAQTLFDDWSIEEEQSDTVATDERAALPTPSGNSGSTSRLPLDVVTCPSHFTSSTLSPLTLMEQ